MINVEILSEDKILTLQNNVEELRDSMLSSQNNEWLKEFFNEEKPFIKSKLFIEDFELDMSTNNPVETDFENAKRLFKNLKITESQACDQRLWIGLTFSKFYDYMTYRYGKTLSQIKNKWLFQGPSYKASLFRQGLSMLWWYAYITYDKNNQENPYELTEYAFNHKDFIIRKTDKEVNFNSNDINAIIDACLLVIEDSLKRGEEISIHGFGTLGLHHRAARKTKRVGTDDWVEIKARYVPKFVSGNNLKLAAKIYELSLQDSSSQEDGE